MKRRIMKRHSAKPAALRSRTGNTPDQWDLTHLMKDPEAEFEGRLKDLELDVTQFETLRSRLSPALSAEAFLEVMALNGRIAEQAAKLSAYAYLWFSHNTKNLQARAFKSKVEERLTALQNRTLFFDLWWQGVDEANATRLLGQSGDLRYYLESIRRYRHHTLSEPEEKIINLKNTTGRSAVNTLYDVLTNGLTFTLDVGGKRRTLTREQLSIYMRSPHSRLREAAYQELFRVFAGHRDVLGEIYATLVNDWKSENLDLRRFSSPIAARNLGNDIPDHAIQSLLSVCSKNAAVFQEYFRLKARICKIKPMNRYHIYAPHQSERMRYRYPDAVKMVLEAYRAFSPRMAELASRVLDDRHLDARTPPGKMSGAFCYSVTPSFTPYVLLNYTGEARDVATLAHEMGHAIHAMMAADHSVFTFHSTLPLAETASVFGERLLSEALMAAESNIGVKQALLLAQLDDIYATVLRQAYFILFETSAHAMIAQSATVEDVSAAYLDNVRQQFGKTVRVADEFRWEWLTIPHVFGSPFYCYSYSFGNLLVLALYQKYKQEGAAFVPKYLKLLAAGGSQSPSAILGEVGVDMCAEDFWQSGFDTIKSMLQELEHTQR